MKIEEKRTTVGAIAKDLMTKAPETSSPLDLEQSMQSEYRNALLECITEAKKRFLSDFYVEVTTKREPLMPNVFRNYFSARLSCPTPNYDQAVYRYRPTVEAVDFIWVIPSRDACHHLKDNAMLVAPEERGLLRFVLDFADGTLFRLCKKLNNEQDDSPLLDI